MFTDIKCLVMCVEDDIIQHILECPVLLFQHTSCEISENANIRYKDVFSSDVSKQKKVTVLNQQLLDIRMNLLNSPPEADTGPVHRI